MRLLKIIVLFLLLPGTLPGQDKEQSLAEAEKDYYNEGVRYKRTGSWAKALSSWEEGINYLREEGKTDSRLGIAYIELVTEQELSYYYEQACEYYMWAFSEENAKENLDVIKKEAERILPLLQVEEHESWEKLVYGYDPAMTGKIREFWTKKDPTPTTVENERLVEHWVRIAYAKKHYNKNNTSIYGTDGRGLIYVKYGEPDLLESGQLGLSRAQLISRISDYLEALQFSGNAKLNPGHLEQAVANVGGEIGDSTGGAAITETNLIINDDGKGDISRSRTVPDNPAAIAAVIEQFDKKPEFELWGYQLEENKDSQIYLFGKSETNGFYGIVASVDEFIPGRLFGRSAEITVYNRAEQVSAPLYPGAFFQIIYYEQMDKFGGAFSERLADLNSIWNEMQTSRQPMSSGMVQSKMRSYISQSKDAPDKKYGPQTKTKLDELTNSVKMINRQIRLLDDENKAKVAILSMPFFGGVNPDDLQSLINGQTVMPVSKIKNSLLIYDANWKELNRITSESETGAENSVMFLVDHNDASLNYVVTAENMEEDDDPELRESLWEKMESGEDIWFGKRVLNKIEPLDTNPNFIEISDPILGLQAPEGFKEAGYPFPVVPSEKIFTGDLMHVYLEVYHLILGSDNKGRFSVDYKIAKAPNTGILSRLRIGQKNSKQIAQRVPFESTESSAQAKIIFDISELEPGDYDYILEVTDMISGQKKSRSGKFAMVKPPG